MTKWIAEIKEKEQKNLKKQISIRLQKNVNICLCHDIWHEIKQHSIMMMTTTDRQNAIVYIYMALPDVILLQDISGVMCKSDTHTKQTRSIIGEGNLREALKSYW